MKEEIVRIRGMFCAHCETRIQNALMKLPSVEFAKASFEKEEVRVIYDPDFVSRDQLLAAIRGVGYEITGGGEGAIQTASILIILLAIYVIASHLGWTQVFNLFPSIERSLSLGMLFVVGLLTSIHCIAMCGGINLGQSVVSARRGGGLFRTNLAYNLGRVISYTLVGALAGGVGSVLSLGGKLKGLTAILAGSVMIVMALNMLGVFKPLRRFSPRVPARLLRAAATKIKSRSSFAIGLLNGLMPCGPLQSMQIYALSTGSIWLGALSMLLFSLGTAPLMLGFGLLAGKLNRRFARVMLSVSALLIFLMGLNMLVNGLSLSGVSVPAVQVQKSVMAMRSDGKQTVVTEIGYGNYPPITVKAGVPVEWTIRVPAGRLNGCNGEIVIPALDVSLKLHEGDNLVGFLPEDAGTIPFSCWMGMIRSSITVIE